MARVDGLRRRRQGSKRLDPTILAELLRDGRVWCSLGIVFVPDGESSHFTIVEEDGKKVDVLVEVETVPEGLDLTCSLAGGGGGRRGAWTIPGEGDRVAVLIPSGELGFCPIITSVLSSGEIPDGLVAGVTVVADGQVLVHDGAGGAVALALKSDVEAVEARLSAHVHVTTATIGASATPGVISAPAIPPATIVGTQVLKGK